MIDELNLVLFCLALAFIWTISSAISMVKSHKILEKLESLKIDFGDNPIIEVVNYNPKTDIIGLFVGSEENIPPQDFLEKVVDTIDKIPKCNILIAPGIYRFIILKDVKK